MLPEHYLPFAVRRFLRRFIVQINDNLDRLDRNHRAAMVLILSPLVIEFDLQILRQRHENPLVVRHQFNQAVDRFRQVLALNLEERNQLERVLFIRSVILAQRYQQRIDIFGHIHLFGFTVKQTDSQTHFIPNKQTKIDSNLPHLLL